MTLIHFTGDMLLAMRNSAGKTTVEMAKAVGVSRQTYEKWENDIGKPDVLQFFVLARYCRFGFDHVLNDLKELVQRDVEGEFDDRKVKKRSRGNRNGNQ